MRSGTIEVRGSTASHAAQQLRGGSIRILGNTGDYLAGPLPGRRSGMSGGRVVVAGSAGHHVGHRMRRGLITVLSDCGDGVASDMIAGTIAVGGKVGELIAAGMRRGTVSLAAPTPLDPIRFVCGSPSPLGITRLIAADLQHAAAEIAASLSVPARRFLGDRSCGGQGEIWQIASVAAAC